MNVCWLLLLATVLCGLLTIKHCLVKRPCNQFADCCFATAGPTLWNSLPEQLRQQDITFIDRWKHLCVVSWAAVPCVWTLRAPTRNLLTYLLTLTQWRLLEIFDRFRAVIEKAAVFHFIAQLFSFLPEKRDVWRKGVMLQDLFFMFMTE